MNKRVVNQYIHPNVCESCALQMGMTELDKTSSWNTMPSHTHERRMEVYFYFELEDDNIVFHFMGQPQETRHIIMHNEQAVISPSWSIHSGTATSNYTFIWGMCGENQTYDDMDTIGNLDLRKLFHNFSQSTLYTAERADARQAGQQYVPVTYPAGEGSLFRG